MVKVSPTVDRVFFRTRENNIFIRQNDDIPPPPDYGVISSAVPAPFGVRLSSVDLCPHPTLASHARPVSFVVHVTFTQTLSPIRSLQRTLFPLVGWWTYIFQKKTNDHRGWAIHVLTPTRPPTCRGSVLTPGHVLILRNFLQFQRDVSPCLSFLWHPAWRK